MRWEDDEIPDYELTVTLNEVHPDVGKQGGRYRQIIATLSQYADCFAGKNVLDFGASSGLSGLALLECGARCVVGVEPDQERVIKGHAFIKPWQPFHLLCVRDTSRLPFADCSFDAVLANAVFEHIPQPRTAYIRECWRVLKPGGVLFVNETPNKYLPYDFHTLHLPLSNWLPSPVAKWIGEKTGKLNSVRDPWDYSGWRGLGFYELLSALPRGSYRVEHEVTRPRHRALRALGLPSSLLDPYPVYRVWKRADV